MGHPSSWSNKSWQEARHSWLQFPGKVTHTRTTFKCSIWNILWGGGGGGANHLKWENLPLSQQWFHKSLPRMWPLWKELEEYNSQLMMRVSLAGDERILRKELWTYTGVWQLFDDELSVLCHETRQRQVWSENIQGQVSPIVRQDDEKITVGPCRPILSEITPNISYYSRGQWLSILAAR